jgi:hypothetical protein
VFTNHGILNVTFSAWCEIKRLECRIDQLGFSVIVSVRGLIMWLPIDGSGDDDGTKPHFIRLSSLTPSL